MQRQATLISQKQENEVQFSGINDSFTNPLLTGETPKTKV